MQRTKVFLIVVAVFLNTGLTAQSKIGLRAGINLANVSALQEDFNPTLDPKSITGLNIAVFTELGISERFAIQPEINFLQKGTQVNGKDIEGNSEVGVKMRVNYLEVPVLAKLKLGADKKLRAYAMLGPSIGYALSGKGTVTIDGVKVTEKIEFDKDMDDGVKDQRWDLSGVAGLGGMLSLGSGDLLLDFRYALDFTDFVKFKDAKPTGHKKSYNRGLGISLGYQVPLGK